MFCDTSTIAKYYSTEAHAAAVRSAIDTAPAVFCSELARLELHSIFHRRLREGTWTTADFQAAVRQFQRHDIAGFWTWLPLERAIIEQASNLFLTLPPSVYLRAADSLHLVAALHYRYVEIHTHDKHQIAAATALGLKPITIT
jgi:predicted nucleic acid-binding protein